MSINSAGQSEFSLRATVNQNSRFPRFRCDRVLEDLLNLPLAAVVTDK